MGLDDSIEVPSKDHRGETLYPYALKDVDRIFGAEGDHLIVGPESSTKQDLIVRNFGTGEMNALQVDALRFIVSKTLHDQHGGWPGIDVMENNNAVAIRPADGGFADIWWDRSDGSKEVAVRADSGTNAASDEDATVRFNRQLDLRNGGPVRSEPMAPSRQISRGLLKIREDFIGSLNSELTDVGTGSLNFIDGLLDGAGGAVEMTTGGSSGDAMQLDTRPAEPYLFDGYLRFRTAINLAGVNNVQRDWGFQHDGNNYIKFQYDDSVSGDLRALCASGGAETSASLGTYSGDMAILELVKDPTGSVTFRWTTGSTSYPDLQDVDTSTTTISTNVPTGAANPYLRVQQTSSTAKKNTMDYAWFEGERSP